jgi:hypothetical protein
MRLSRAVLVVAALVLGGCGPAGERPASTPPATQVTIIVRADGTEATQQGSVLTCPGDDRCARLEKADFSLPSKAIACTQIYGGKATALVTGRVGGRDIHTEFDLHDGCAVARWQKFSWLLGRPPPS